MRKITIFQSIFLAAVLSSINCSKSSSPPRPNIILISADTLRADHLGCYGYPKETTPHLDRFAEDCVVFDRAYSQIPGTLQSHMSIFTGLYPEVHGLLDKDAGSLNPQFSTITEELKKAGYYTAGGVSNVFLKEEFGFGRGFDEYHRLPRKLTFAEKLNDGVFKRLARMPNKNNKHFFLFLHYYDPHSDFYETKLNQLPYYAPQPFLEKFCPNPELSLAYHKDLNAYASEYLGALNAQKIEVKPAVLQAIISLYDAGIAYFDDQIGALFTQLKEKGLYDDSLIIFTSDHGEEFREHGEFIHDQVYEECIRVPLLVKFPRGSFKPGRREQPVELIDIMPTLLDYLRLPIPGYLQGVSFLPAITGEKTGDKPIFARKKSFASGRGYSLTEGRLKLLYDPDSGRLELYNLKEDPGEKNNLAKEMPEAARRLEKRLKARLRANRELALTFQEGEQVPTLNAQDVEKLKTLGYFNE